MEPPRLETRCYVCGQPLDPRAAAYDVSGARHIMCLPRRYEEPKRRIPPCSAHDFVVDGD